MKFFRYTLMTLALACAVTSCGDDNDYVEGPQSPGAYFPKANPSSIRLDADASTFDVAISRTDGTEAATYTLTSEADAAIFTIPASVSFDAGSTSTVIPVTYDFEALGYDNTQTITISLPDADASQYGKDKYTFTVVVPAPWTSLGMGQMVDAIVAPAYGVAEVTFPVEIQENDITPGYFRIVNPYTTENYPYYEPGDEVDPDAVSYIYLDATDPEDVSFPLTSLNIDWGDGAIRAIGYNDFMKMSDREVDPKMNGIYNKDEGIISFPGRNSIFFVLGSDLYNANPGGTFKVYMPGVVIKDYTATVGYKGLFMPETGAAEAVLSVNVGTDVTSAKVGILPGMVEAAAIEAVAGGTVETLEFKPGEGQSCNIAVEGSGWFTAAIVAYDGEEQVGASSVTFKIQAAGASEGNWEALGDAIFVDGWILPLFGSEGSPVDPTTMPYKVPVEKSLDTEGLYRIVNPYNVEDCPIAEYNDDTAGAKIVIDATDPAFVSIESQYSGYVDADGEIYIGNAGWYLEVMMGASRDQITAKGFNSTFADGVIDIVAPLYGMSATDFGYGDAAYDTVITLPGASAAQAAARAIRRNHVQRPAALRTASSHATMGTGSRLLGKRAVGTGMQINR